MIFNTLVVSFLPYFCILSLATIALIFSERAGIINLGINGIIVFGATIYMFFANLISGNSSEQLSGWYQVPLYLLSAIGGMIFSCLHGFVCIKLKANQMISGIALNILAPALTLLILLIFGSGNQLPFNIKELALGNHLKYEITNIISLKVFTTIFIILISFIILSFTRWGLHLKAIGENPQAADVAGINVNKNKWIAVLISGFLAGVAGAIFISMRSDGRSFKGDVESLGFLAIAIMIVGRWKILNSMFAVVVFSMLFSLIKKFTTIFPSASKGTAYLINIIPYLLTIVFMIFFSKPFMSFFKKLIYSQPVKNLYSKITKKTMIDKTTTIHWNGPKSAGEPYDKSKR